MPSNLVFAPVRRLGEMVRTRQVSPVELTAVFLDRLEHIGPRYNAVASITRERAEQQARNAEREISAGRYRGPLHGIPYGIKDLFSTSGGIPTGWGARHFDGQQIDYDATVVRKLEAAGAVMIGKLATVELAGNFRYDRYDNSSTGAGLNPWDTKTWAGGSSNGSGSAVCAGLVPFAIGTETWGSILGPSNNCGISGLRPTHGRVSRYGAMPLSWTLDKPGPMCLTADDCGLVLEAIAGHDPEDEFTSEREYRYTAAEAGRKLKLAVRKGATEGADPEVAANFETALKALGEVADIDEIEFPDMPYGEITIAIFFAESASIWEEFIDSGLSKTMVAPESRAFAYPRMSMLATDYLKAVRLRKVMCREIDSVIAPYDAVAAPTSPFPAPPVIKKKTRKKAAKAPKDIMGAIGNGAGLPSASVPTGFTKAGLPTCIQFMGRAYNENAVLAVARAYQSVTEWHTRHPADVMG